jgi:hypothetical protein
MKLSSINHKQLCTKASNISRTYALRLVFTCLTMLAIIGFTAAKASAATGFAVTSTNELIRFNTDTPGVIITSTLITGLQSGETILGMDFRPIDNRLYALGSTGRIYTLNLVTGVATLQAVLTADPTDNTNPFTALSGTSFGVDFNPVPDRMRVVSDADQNLRINVLNGQVITDTALNPGNPNIVGSAYTNNFPNNITTTTLYAIDSNTDSLYTQAPPNDGTLNIVGAGLGVDTSDQVGFDVFWDGANNIAFATLTVGGSSGVYNVNLGRGRALPR